MIKIALESVCMLLGENAADWKAIRAVTMKDNFIPTIVNFNTDDITEDICENMKRPIKVKCFSAKKPIFLMKVFIFRFTTDFRPRTLTKTCGKCLQVVIFGYNF